MVTRLDDYRDDYRAIDPEDGERIAAANYRQTYGRDEGAEIVADPERAAQIIRASERYLRGFHISNYATVLRGFRGDHRIAKASLEAIPKLEWLNNGTLRLPGDG